jgi:DNA-binding transcriptional MerR regulator
MVNFLTIGEFAALRNVDRKSLRYYERIGALVPAYTDPVTKYRYYKLEQMADLDTILMCLELDIPLKEATRYKNEDGTLDILKLFNDGKQKVNEKLLHLFMTMKQLENSIRAMEENEAYKHEVETYKRHIGKRYVLRTPFVQSEDEYYFRRQANELCMKARKEGLFPVFNFPVGIMAEKNHDDLDIYIIVEVFVPEANHPELLILPEGDYLCRQEHHADMHHPSYYCLDLFTENPDLCSVVVTNMTLDSFEKGVFPLEVQVLI